jgi:hypothetical protein
VPAGCIFRLTYDPNNLSLIIIFGFDVSNYRRVSKEYTARAEVRLDFPISCRINGTATLGVVRRPWPTAFWPANKRLLYDAYIGR